MDIRATCSFSGQLSMRVGEVRAVSDELAADLIQAGYAEAEEAKPPKKQKQREE